MTAPANGQPLGVSIRMSSVPAYRVFESLGAEAGSQRPFKPIRCIIRFR